MNFMPYLEIKSFIVLKAKHTEESEQAEIFGIENNTNGLCFRDDTIDSLLQKYAVNIAQF